ncbi:hypothetical protein Tco_0917541 [Tanacetum coccineum]
MRGTTIARLSVVAKYSKLTFYFSMAKVSSKGYDSCEKNTFLRVIESYTVINFLDMLGQRIYDNSFRALKDDEGLFLVRWGTRWRLRFSGKMIKAGEKNSALVDEVKYGCNGVIMHFPKSVMQENAQSYEGSKEVTSTNIVKFESNNGIGSSDEGKPRKKKRRSFFPRKHGNAAEKPCRISEMPRKGETRGNAEETSPRKVETFFCLGFADLYLGNV